MLRGLIERKLVRIAGHRDVPGRPMLYATTRRFLEVFELSKLEDLPTLRDLQELAPQGAPPGAPALEPAAGSGSQEVQTAGAEAAGDVALAPSPAE